MSDLEKITIGGYTLAYNEQRALHSSLDVYSRFLLGQFSELGSMYKLRNHGFNRPKLLQVEKLLTEAQTILYGSPTISKKISSDSVSHHALLCHILGKMIEGQWEEVPKLRDMLGIHTPNSPHNQLGGFIDESEK